LVCLTTIGTIWHKRSHVLAPLMVLTHKGVSFKWTDEAQQAFDTIKKKISAEVLLSFPDYTKPFDLYPNASDYQLGTVLMQEGKPIAFFSRKLTSAQKNYSVGEKEMLSIVESLHEFCNILLGYPINIHMDHLNLSHDTKQFKNARIM